MFVPQDEVACLGGDAHSHIVRLTHKIAVAILKKNDWQERGFVTDECHDRSGKPVKRSDEKLGPNSSERQLSDARQLGCAFQDMTPPKCILQKSTVQVQEGFLHVTPKFETKTLAPLHLSPTLQNLRIVHKKRQSGRSKVPANQRGSWAKMC